MDMFLLRLRHVVLWAMLFAVGVLSPLTFAYDGNRQATVAYGSPSLAAFDYDVAFVSPAKESENRAAETGRIFAQLAEFLAAKGGVWSLGPGPRGLAIFQLDFQSAALEKAITIAMSKGNPIVPTPTRAAFPKPVVLAYAKVKSWSAFERNAMSWTIVEKAGKYQIEPGRKRADGKGWEPDPDRVESLPPGTTLDSVA